MKIALDNLIRQLLEQMKKETALTSEESEQMKNDIEEILILEGYLHG